MDTKLSPVIRHLVEDLSKKVFPIALPALLILGITVYLIAHQPSAEKVGHLAGKPLAAYPELYPIQSDEHGRLFLDTTRFVKAISALTQEPSPKAIADLIYLGQSNNVSLQLRDPDKRAYQNLLQQPDYAKFSAVNQQKDRIFQVYKDIVNGIGLSFSGTPIEIVLHDTRNPLQSVVALQNPISGRYLNDPNTNFGVELIKNYSQVNAAGSSYLSYGLTLKDGRNIKSSTIPLYDDVFGLVGFICLNIDISKLDPKNNPAAVTKFIEQFKLVNDNQKIQEIIENSRHSAIKGER